MIPTHSGAPGTDASRAEVSTKGAGATHRPHIREVLAYASSLNALPIGGRLLNFGDRWLRLTTVSWIRDLFSYGYAIEFWATPSDRFHPSPCPRAPARHNIMQTAIHHLLDIAAIEPVPTTERSEGVYSLLFAVPKRDLSWRAVLDLTGHCQLQPSQSSFEPCTAPLLPLVDQGSTPLQGHVVQRTPQNRCNHRCQPHRLGSPLQLPVRSGGLVHRGANSKHQLAGAKGCPLSSTSFSVSVPFGPCAHSNRQHVCKITFEQTRGHQVSSPAGLSLPHFCLGRTTSTIPESRTSQRDLECDSRLAQQTTDISGRMETSSSHFPSSPMSVRRPLSQPVCSQSQLPASQVLCPIPGLNSRSSGCSDNTVARWSIVRLSSHTIVSQNLEEGANREGTAGSDSTILATPTVVFRSSGNVNDGSLDTSSQARPSIPGSSTAPGPYLAQSNSVAFEWGHLWSAGLSDAVIDIILASRRPSTTRIYQHTWVAFSKWCQSHHHDPSQATVHQVLQFLHSGFMMGLRPNTLCRHASTLSSILSVSFPGEHISSHPFIKRFLRGVALRSPPVVHRFPSWSLPKVLQALQRPLFEPIRSVPLRMLSFKVLFLIAITSARRVSELGALSSARHLCVFHKDSVVLKTDPSFRPKVDSVFHCNQDIVLPSFCPNPTHPLEKAWHLLDVRRALKTYLSRTQEIRRTESLFSGRGLTPLVLTSKTFLPSHDRWS
ncbi:oxysterol-binding protein-related protein 9 isoform X4 [Rhineura floridana]|uniref:oxysterol-binding protein-related protein 9 isoform X4 n=1 Tax=Rhineura floridana TaxID=261503 RepID=UPI002AC8554F|nr:oxysterol-binding protein-related protein 9 isoform X4 [Rhineura floridana]